MPQRAFHVNPITDIGSGSACAPATGGQTGFAMSAFPSDADEEHDHPNRRHAPRAAMARRQSVCQQDLIEVPSGCGLQIFELV